MPPVPKPQTVRLSAKPINPEGPSELSSPELYFNRELSLLAFHHRVFEQARDESLPLLERLRFLCIASTNLDEFFEVRVAGLRKQAKYGIAAATPDGMTVGEVLKQVYATAHELVAQQYKLLNEDLLPGLAAEGIRFLRRAQWTAAQRAWIRSYFESQLLPIMSPIRLDPSHPFPRVLNKALHFIVKVAGEDAFGQAGGMAVVQAPRVLPRFLRLPTDIAGPDDFVFLSSVIHAHVNELFTGMEVVGCFQFRVTRDTELMIDTEEIDDLRSALEGELPSRRYGDSVRLEVADNCPADMCNYLLEQFSLSSVELFQVDGPVNLGRLVRLPDQVDHAQLKYPPFQPSVPAAVTGSGDLFESISRGDILLHHPFQSFNTVLEFVRQAATDPNVLAIKQTLYRVGEDSALTKALLQAARTRKEVTVLVELLARFDEEANLALAAQLQEAGAHVVYGVVGYKTHAKMLMVVRREGDRLRRYVHLGTGNYHTKTTRVYTDFGLLTCDPDICEDVHKIFLQLTSLGKATELKKLYQSPFTMFGMLLDKIGREADHARAGKPARIVAKMNSLVEPKIIEALYAASNAGVQIDLVVRGICVLRPQVPGVSENIRVRSIVGRFLEHTRAFTFENDGKPEVFCASADWMVRNLHRRIETCFPIEDPNHRRAVIEQGLEVYLRDNVRAWELSADGTYTRLQPGDGEPPVSAQDVLLDQLAEG